MDEVETEDFKARMRPFMAEPIKRKRFRHALPINESSHERELRSL